MSHSGPHAPGRPLEGEREQRASARDRRAWPVVHRDFRELREKLGRKFGSETDTEVVAHRHRGDARRRPRWWWRHAQAVAPRLRARIFVRRRRLDDRRAQGSPLAVGYGKGEMYLGSDAIALAPFTDQVSYLERHRGGRRRARASRFTTAQHKKVERAIIKSAASGLLVDKGNYKHFMPSSRKWSAIRSRTTSTW